jgi:DNA-directed RNA polymerase subunit A'
MKLVRNKLKEIATDEERKMGWFPCNRCGEYTPHLTWQHQAVMWRVLKTPRDIYEGDRNIQMGAVYSLLENIPTKHHKFLGFFGTSNPVDMYWQALPVSPITMRPNTYSEVGELELNELSTLYQNIVIQNNRIIKRQQTNQEYLWIEKDLYRACTHLITNENKSIGAGGTRTIRDKKGLQKTIALRGVLNRVGKSGRRKTRMRRDIQTKVVNQVAYTVVSPNPDLSIDEVGVPYEVCTTCTVDEEVTLENIERLQEMVINGADVYPGAHYYVQGGLRENEVPEHNRFKRMLRDTNWNTMRPTRLEEAWHEYLIGNDINLEEMKSDEVDRLRLDFKRDWNRAKRTEQFQLEVGELVGRMILAGDWGLFNRAPSLHRQNVMGFKVRPLPQKTLSMNPTVCIPFNADYDGDHMKLHFVQSPEAIAETKSILALGRNLIHSRYGKLTIATDQDQTTGLAILTMSIASKKGQYSDGLGYTKEEGIPFLDEDRARNMIGAAWYTDDEGVIQYPFTLPDPDYKFKGKMYWTGRAIISSLFPDFLNAIFQGNNPVRDDEGNIIRIPTNKLLYNGEYEEKEIKETVIIRDGLLITGTLDKSAFGEGGASIAPSFFYHYGYDEAYSVLTQFINQITRMSLEAHKQIGFSIGPEDCSLMSLNIREPLKEQYDMVSKQIMKYQRAYDNRTLDELPNLTPADRKQIRVEPLAWAEERMVALADDYESYITDMVSDAAGSANPIQIAVRSKARGSLETLRQMSASYGQMRYGGRRPIWGINTNRTMSHYPLPDYEPEHPRHKGFIFNSYGSGLDPDEYWLASTAGRRSQAESSIGAIQASGHLEYKVKRAIEDVVVDEDRNAIDVRDGTIVSYNLGGDGLKPFHIRGARGGPPELSPDGRVITLQPLLFEFHCKHGRTLMDECSDCTKSMNADFIFEEVEYANASGVKLVEFLAGREILKPEARKLIKKFNWWFEESQCKVGEAIGATAASNLGEPVTQAGLRSFHGGGKFSTQGSVEGILRCVEISVPNKRPETIIYLKPKLTKSDAKRIARFCTSSLLGEYITSVHYTDDSLKVAVDPRYLAQQGIDRGFAERQITRVMGKKGFTIEQNLKDHDEFILKGVDVGPHDLLLAKEQLDGIQISGLSGAEFALVEKPKEKGLGAGLYRIRIRGPARGDSTVLWDEIHELLKDYIEPEFTWTTEFWVVYKRLGLEAMLSCIYEQIDQQMNGDKGLGEFDHRYIRVLVDRIGQKGYPVPLTADRGWGGSHSPSYLAALAGEAITGKITAGAMMNTVDKLRGMVEAVTTGNTAKIGSYVIDE